MKTKQNPKESSFDDIKKVKDKLRKPDLNSIDQILNMSADEVEKMPNRDKLLNTIEELQPLLDKSLDLRLATLEQETKVATLKLEETYKTNLIQLKKIELQIKRRTNAIKKQNHKTLRKHSFWMIGAAYLTLALAITKLCVELFTG